MKEPKYKKGDRVRTVKIVASGGVPNRSESLSDAVFTISEAKETYYLVEESGFALMKEDIAGLADEQENNPTERMYKTNRLPGQRTPHEEKQYQAGRLAMAKEIMMKFYETDKEIPRTIEDVLNQMAKQTAIVEWLAGFISAMEGDDQKTNN